MTRIRATCPACGEVDLRPDDIELTIVGSDMDRVEDGSRYRFCCPDCTQEVSKPANTRIARLLQTGGVSVTLERPGVDTSAVEEALEAIAFLNRHPEQPPLGPPLTKDDLLDLHLLLESDDWFDQLLQLT